MDSATNTEELQKANINNLTSLWKVMGLKPQTDSIMTDLNISLTWPNRCWVDVDSGTSLLQFSKVLPHCSTNLLPIWDLNLNETCDADSVINEDIKNREILLLENNFICLFQQTAMILALSSAHQKTDETFSGGRHNIQAIHSHEDIEIWTDIASQSFGYQVDITTIRHIANNENITLLMHQYDGQAAGVAMLYKTDEIIGVHQVGVLNEYRGKGIARILMQHVINLSKEQQARYITLQASVIGEPLYRRLGFSEQFKIRSYMRST